MIPVILDDIMMEVKRFKVALGQSRECKLLPISCEYKLFLSPF